MEVALDITRAVAQQVLQSRGLLPEDLPDFTTEKGHHLLGPYAYNTHINTLWCLFKVRIWLPGLANKTQEEFSQNYASALTQYIQKQNLNAPQASASFNRPKDASKLDGFKDLSVGQLLELLGDNSVDACVNVLQQLNTEDYDSES